MTATDELRKLLDERGIGWKEHIHSMPGSMAEQRETLWGKLIDPNDKLMRGVYNFRATEMSDGRLFLEAQLTTPEQAIAATLGKPTLNANLEQALSFMRIWISDDAHLGESELSAVFEKAEGLRKLDSIEMAIADTLGHSLNNQLMSETLSERETCHIIKRWSDSDFIDNWKYLCSECGCFIPVNERDEETGDVISAANYCPNCGAKVRSDA